ncbi:hypothetical protein MTsPCn9_15390 [Croceitalea sp. MTPC9]|nr:hypothetical protein MTsPCn6_13740 [Croceitalea sp. MTPC6]GMN16603.1 hypothetical protein MTsPCn9_15390 [Croceitalea sp. MTPC9]
MAQPLNLGTTLKIDDMKRFLLIKEIYLEGFKNLGHFLVEKYFKIFSWFCFILFFVVLYAFVYRVATGFAFD